MKYNIFSQTVLKARYTGLDIEINVAVLDKLTLNVILGYSLLEKNFVTLDYTAH